MAQKVIAPGRQVAFIGEGTAEYGPFRAEDRCSLFVSGDFASGYVELKIYTGESYEPVGSSAKLLEPGSVIAEFVGGECFMVVFGGCSDVNAVLTGRF